MHILRLYRQYFDLMKNTLSAFMTKETTITHLEYMQVNGSKNIIRIFSGDKTNVSTHVANTCHLYRPIKNR